MPERLQFSLRAMLVAFVLIALALTAISDDSPSCAGLLLLLLLATPGVLVIGLMFGDRIARAFCVLCLFPASVGFLLAANNLFHAPHGDQFGAVVNGGLTNASRYLRYPALVVWSVIIVLGGVCLIYHVLSTSNKTNR